MQAVLTARLPRLQTSRTSSTPTGCAALQAYDPEVISGERRVYARVVSGVTDTSGDYEWLNVTDAVAGNFLPLSGGTVDGYTNFTAGLGISGNVQITGNITQTGNHTTSGTYNASRNSNPNQVLYQVNNSAGRGMYQGDHQGVAFAKGGSGVAEFTVTGDQTFAVISGDLRVGNDNQNVSDTNSSQFWALSGGQFISAFSTNESVVWKGMLPRVRSCACSPTLVAPTAPTTSSSHCLWRTRTQR